MPGSPHEPTCPGRTRPGRACRRRGIGSISPGWATGWDPGRRGSTAKTSDVRIQISEYRNDPRGATRGLRWLYLNSEFCILTSDVFAVRPCVWPLCRFSAPPLYSSSPPTGRSAPMRYRLVALFALLTLPTPTVLAQTPTARPPASQGIPEIKYEKFILPNGLTLLVHED